MNEVIISIISGTVGGLVVWLFQQWYLNRRESKILAEENVIKAKHLGRILTDSVIWNLRPGTSVDLMRDMLGVPTKQSNTDWPVFTEKETATNSYLYVLNNAYLKITSKDNKTIDSLTLLPHDKSFHLDDLVFPCGGAEFRLNVMKICKEVVDISRNHTFIRTRIDASFAIEYYIPNPLYQSYTYFGYGPENSWDYLTSKNANLFVGSIVNGVCISNSSDNVYFIYEMEIR